LHFEFSAAGVTETHTPVGSQVIANDWIPTVDPSSIEDSERLAPFTNGFYTISGASEGGLEVSFTALDLSMVPMLYSNQQIVALSRDAIYYRADGPDGDAFAGDEIMRIELKAGATPEVFHSSPDLIELVQVVKGVAIFKQYITGTEIGLYALSSPGGAPTLLRSSDMEIREIVQLGSE